MLRRAMLMDSSQGLTSAGVVDGEIQDDWGTIGDICESGRGPEFYSIGNYKPLTLTNGDIIDMCLVGFNRDHNLDGLPTTSFFSSQSIKQAITIVGDAHKGWAMGDSPSINQVSTETYFQNEVIPLIPEAIKKRIKPVVKDFTYNHRIGYKVVTVWPPGYGEFISQNPYGCFYPEYVEFMANGGTPVVAGFDGTGDEKTILRDTRMSYGVGSAGSRHYVNSYSNVSVIYRGTLYTSQYGTAGYGIGFCL